MDKFQTHNDDSPKRIEIDVEILHHTQVKPYKWGDVLKQLEKKKITLQESDEIRIEFVEAYYSEDNSWDAHFSCSVIRPRSETDKEFNERLVRVKRTKEDLKKRRYETYLKLKAEFETPKE